MPEISQKLQYLTESEILLEFRASLLALLPILQRLDCIEDDTSLYDPYDRIVETLWDELVLESLKWKHGLESKPKLPGYGMTGIEPQADGCIVVESSGRELLFVGFIGDRSLGPEAFNAVLASRQDGSTERLALTSQVKFHWQRRKSEA